MKKLKTFLTCCFTIAMCLPVAEFAYASNPSQAKQGTEHSFTVATFNVSMEARNYVDANTEPERLSLGQTILIDHLQSGLHPQIKNVAEIIQRVAPDVILLNEFDFIDNPKLGVEAFINNYLSVSQNGAEPIDYPYYFVAPSNTGLPTVFDLNNDGEASRFANDAQGFGLYTGHYGMALLSKYPINKGEIRTFQRFLWSDMPNAMKPIDPESQQPFYDELEWLNLRLSSKSHWDVPIEIEGKQLHVLASHPTPPVFDGDEDRNGKRNNDENRFWLDYISPGQGAYIYDDRGIFGALKRGAHFVLAGDFNASPDRVQIENHAILQLTKSALVNESMIPMSESGAKNRPDNPYAKHHTASWGARVDYVLPSSTLKVIESGIFWPDADDPLHRLVSSRERSSDHYLVWTKLSIAP